MDKVKGAADKVVNMLGTLLHSPVEGEAPPQEITANPNALQPDVVINLTMLHDTQPVTQDPGPSPILGSSSKADAVFDVQAALNATHPQSPAVEIQNRPVVELRDEPDAESGALLLQQEFVTLFDDVSVHRGQATNEAKSAVQGVDKAKAEAVQEISGAISSQVDSTARQYSYTREQFDDFCTRYGAKWAPSASAGRSLRGNNDHAGVLVVPARDPQLGAVTERLTVLTLAVPGEAAPRYMVVGYGNRVIDLHLLDELMGDLAVKRDARGPTSAQADPEATAMETLFRTRLLQCSRRSELCLRRDASESDQMLMPVPPNAADVANRKPKDWDNWESFAMAAAGRKDGFANRPIYLDYNVVEDRILIFRNKYFGRERGENDPVTKRHHDVKVGGMVLCEIRGIRNLEVIQGDRGVKGNKFNQCFAAVEGLDTIIRIKTDDGAKHEIRLMDLGVQMHMIGPKAQLFHSESGAAFGAGDPIAAVDVYSFWGLSNGWDATEDGFPDSVLITSCGDRIPAGTFLVDAGSWQTAVTRVAEGVGVVVTANISLGQNRSLIAKMVSEALNTAVKGLVVGLSSMAVEAVRNPSGSILWATSTFAFTSVGAGPLGPGMVVASLVTMMVSHAAVTVMGNLLGHLYPRPLLANDSRLGWWLSKVIGPIGGELLRLYLNLGLQAAFRFPRGGMGDAASLVPMGLITVGLRSLKDYMSTEHNPNHLFEFFMDTLEFFNNSMFRALGNTWGNGFSIPVSAEGHSAYAEALTSRVLMRVADKWLMPTMATIMTAAGFMGPSAAAFDHQIAREGQGLSWVAKLRVVLDRGVKITARLDKSIVKSNAVMYLGNWVDAWQKWVNQEVFVRGGRWWNEIAPNPEEVKEAEESVRTAKLQEEIDKVPKGGKVPQELQEELDKILDDMAERFEQEVMKLHEGGRSKYTYVDKDLHPQTLRERQKLEKVAAEKLDKGANEAVQPHLIGRLPDGRQMTVDGKYVKQDFTTFSTLPQQMSLDVHKATRKTTKLFTITPPGMEPPLSDTMKARMRQAIDFYTEDSQFLHYPLRWNITGNKKRLPITKHIAIEYNVMHSPNIGELDPRHLLYMNLGALTSYKQMVIGQRVLVTEAVYRAVYQALTSLRQELLQINPGQVVALTETFSLALSAKLAAGFGHGLGFGEPEMGRSQKLVVLGRAVNITNLTRLVNTELIILPGAVFVVRAVDETGVGREKNDPEADGALLPAQKSKEEGRPLGQVVYFELVNTHEWERAWKQWKDWKKDPKTHQCPEEGTLLAHPKTGHVYAVGSKGELRWMSTTNYVLGKPMDEGKTGPKGEDEPANELARWRHPFTADNTPRTMKDAIHAAIVEGDPIVAYLNFAIRNVTHEHWRQQGGFDQDAEKQRLDTLKKWGKKEGERIAGLLTSDKAQLSTPDEVNAVAWLATSFLRLPVQLVEVVKGYGVGEYVVWRDSKGNHQGQLINTTYDKVALYQTVEATPSHIHMIGVSEDAFHAIYHSNGQEIVVPIAGGRTAKALLHALARSAYLRPYHYVKQGDELRPGSTATDEVDKLASKMATFVQTDYIVLQEALWKLFTGALKQEAPALKGDVQAAAIWTWRQPTAQEMEQRRIQDVLGGLAAFSERSVAWLGQQGLAVAWNSGNGSNCLLISLLQHATGHYDAQSERSLKDFAATIRARMVALGVCAPDGGLSVQGTEFETAIDIVNEMIGVDLSIAVVAPHRDPHKPAANRYEPVVLNTRDGTTAPMVILYGQNGAAHFEAVYQRQGDDDSSSTASQELME